MKLDSYFIGKRNDKDRRYIVGGGLKSKGRYLRVTAFPDRETVLNSSWDRSFKEK